MPPNHPCIVTGPAAERGRANILSSREWARICGQLKPPGQDDAQLREQQRQYAEYLRTGSAAMTRNWTNSRRALSDKKLAEQRAHLEAIVRDGEQRFQELKESDERLRRERIEAAQRLLDRVKIGPRQLESAYLMADVLQTRQQQRDQNAAAKEARKERERRMGEEMLAAARQGTEELSDMIVVRKRAQAAYKSELAGHIRTERSQREADKAKQDGEDRRDREMAEKGLLEQKKREMTELKIRKVAENERMLGEIRAKRELEQSE